MINLNKKKVGVGTAIMIAALTAVAVFIICLFALTNVFNSRISNLNHKEEFLNKFNQISDIISQKYVYESEIDYTKMKDYAFYGYVAALGDKYSSYYSKDDFKKLIDSSKGNMVGIGISVILDKDSGNIKIIEVYENSPADRAGVFGGDIITFVEGKSVIEEGYEASINKMLGAAGQTVNFTVSRNQENIDYSIVRAEIKVNPVSYKMLSPNIGYIRIKEFTADVYFEFESALEHLKTEAGDENLTGLIFDVRNNPGGTLDSIVKVLDRLLPEGDVVKLIDRDGKEQVFKSDSNQLSLQMAVLTNENTASAAELFSGALRDYNKADIIGTKTYGKGCAQGLFELKDGSGLVLTDVMYYTPSGNNFEGNGLDPDYVVNIDESLINQLFLLSPEDDPQLSKALEIISAPSSDMVILP